jgi:hypothetical protein
MQPMPLLVFLSSWIPLVPVFQLCLPVNFMKVLTHPS